MINDEEYLERSGHLEDEAELENGRIKKAVSYIMAIPRLVEDISSPAVIMERLTEAKEFNFLGFREGDLSDNLIVDVLYKEEAYEVEFFVEEFELSRLYSINHRFLPGDFEIMRHASSGLTTAMIFGEDMQDSYHLQLKVLACMLPDMAGIVDFSSERIISPVWTMMAAASMVPPAPTYLYSIQAVCSEEENSSYWLHSHGLNRCGIVELEVIDSCKEQYNDHISVMNIMASKAISEKKFVEEGEPSFIAGLPDGGALIGTWLSWDKAVDNYATGIPGGREDREEDHNEDTGVIYIYLSREDFEAGRLTPLVALEEDIYSNPLLMITNQETKRMKELAQERLVYLREGLLRLEAKALVKMRLDVDKDKIEDAGTEYEHIWFEVKELGDNYIDAKLIQEPYYVESMHEGSEKRMPLELLTDWMLYVDQDAISPDNAYLLVQGIATA